MGVLVVTGSAGLIGAETVRQLAPSYERVIGVDNDMRRYFFGDEASSSWAVEHLRDEVGAYDHRSLDIRDRAGILELFGELGSDIAGVVHSAAQPSHDWAAREPFTDFDVNAVGTLNLLEATRLHAPTAPFVFLSTNKVYGDRPNDLPLVETATRWEIDPAHEFAGRGIPESMPIDHTTHSLFGASKTAADLLTQEYGRYFGMNTVVFRGGCLTGPGHSGAELHGFLAYLMMATATGRPYTVFGHGAKQVRDNIHASDLVRAIACVLEAPVPGSVYNIGGGADANVSMLEAIDLCEELTGRRLDWTYADEPRVGDHIWYVSDLTCFRRDYPGWNMAFDVPATLADILEAGSRRW